MQRAPRLVLRVGEEREDGGEVCPRGAREAQPVLLGAWMGPFVGPDPARTVFLHAHAREEAPARSAPPVRPGVLLLQRPESRLVILDDHALAAPGFEFLGRGGVRVVPERQVDPHHVVRRAALELASLGRVDHVVGGRDDILQPAGSLEVVVERPERLDLGHEGG
jgi:hypothetical protein